MVRYEGYLKRAYRVNRGAVIDVHPDDVDKLMRSGFFALTPMQDTAVVVEESEPIQEPQPTANIDATDGALELAEANGIDLSAVEGTGANGRIVLRDVKALISD
ncbi:MAG: E3 binding domain-containing protein [Anaerolineales bacterium]|nr:E3 binding domain-containing protein [Anaerolineales bacterium]